jgi:hypothetical protein
MTSVKKNQE